MLLKLKLVYLKNWLGLLLISLVPSVYAGITVQRGAVLDSQGKPFVISGFNVTHAWSPQTTKKAIHSAASFGVNTIRVVLSNGHIWRKNTPEEVQGIIQQAKSLGIVTMLEVHETTGFGSNDHAISIGQVMPFWLSLVDVLKGTEGYVMINIGNEPVHGEGQLKNWKQPHIDGINLLRDAGLGHLMVVDALSYGQDHERIMVKHAADISNADPLHNVLYSVHMYQVYPNALKVQQYFNDFKMAKLPLIVGEFGDEHQGQPVDEDAILKLGAEYKVGLLAWSWTGNNTENRHLDLAVKGNPDELSSWGQRFLLGENGVCQTSRLANFKENNLHVSPEYKSRCEDK
ncbi:cellulase family glycosylhydrolase [Paraglaciecola sp.]|uniref:cellulase family glycosylhydrolase n=1 Tax=Paraglaciecola sp. TaxID=1920173 RepID=UPI003EF7CD87